LDGVGFSAALIDETGEILCVNRPWRAFAEANGVAPEAVSEGVNYLAVCDEADGESVDDARAFGAGIRQLLRGALDTFSTEYPCHSPTEKRWFTATASAIRVAGRPHVVIAHLQITDRVLAEQAVERERERAARILEGTNAGTWDWNIPTGELVINARWAEIMG
jgi:PAS domain-containing protein